MYNSQDKESRPMVVYIQHPRSSIYWNAFYKEQNRERFKLKADNTS